MPNEYSRGHVHVFGPYLYRSEFWAETPSRSASGRSATSNAPCKPRGPDTIAAFLFETIPGTAGILVPPPGYLAGCARDRRPLRHRPHLDEVMAGFARAGEWFAFDAFDVRPDLITFAKASTPATSPSAEW